MKLRIFTEPQQGSSAADLARERVYLQTLDLADLDQLDLIAAEVMPDL